MGCVAHKCNYAEANYSSNKGELAAVVMGCRKFEHLLAYKPFLIRTDNAAVTWLHNMNEKRGIYSRWADTLSLFNFTLEHKPGKSNLFADSLSRRTDHEYDEPDEEEAQIRDVYQIELTDEILSEPTAPSGRSFIMTSDKW